MEQKVPLTAVCTNETLYIKVKVNYMIIFQQ